MLRIANVDLIFALLYSIPFYECLFHCNFRVDFIFANFIQRAYRENKCHAKINVTRK